MFFDTSYDPYRFASPSPSYASMRRRELARRQRAMEEERRRKAGIERRRRMEAELARQRESEAWGQMERSRRRGLAQTQPGQSNAPSYRVVRGPDSSLYRVPLAERNDVAKSQSKDTPSYRIVRGPDGRLYRVPCSQGEDATKPQSNKNRDENVDPSMGNSESEEEEAVCTQSESKENDDGSISSGEWYGCRDVDDGPQTMAADAVEEKNVPSPASPQIVVENVPDEEDEDLREMRSIWRNRTPSPGQWMEPVEVETYRQ